MQKCIAHLVIPSLKIHCQGVSFVRVTFWLSSRSVECRKNRSADRDNALCHQVSMWEEIKIKKTHLLGYSTGKLCYCVSAGASCFIDSSGLSLDLSRGGGFFFLIRPAPLLPFNAWQVLAGGTARHRYRVEWVKCGFLNGLPNGEESTRTTDTAAACSAYISHHGLLCRKK